MLIVALAGICLAGGWWLGQRSAGARGPLPTQIALQHQARQLQRSIDQGRASEAEKERLLQILLALEQKPEATKLLERLADQNPERWPLRLLLAELRRDQNDRAGAEREVRQILNLSPGRMEALQLRTLLQLEQGRGGEAQAQLQAAFLKANTAPVSANALPLGLLLADLLQRQKQGAPPKRSTASWRRTTPGTRGHCWRWPCSSRRPATPRGPRTSWPRRGSAALTRTTHGWIRWPPTGVWRPCGPLRSLQLCPRSRSRRILGLQSPEGLVHRVPGRGGIVHGRPLAQGVDQVAGVLGIKDGFWLAVAGAVIQELLLLRRFAAVGIVGLGQRRRGGHRHGQGSHEGGPAHRENCSVAPHRP
ncbi:hypothetical protein [Cyanobium sp. ATX-6F1]|uniref:hypothetical protein n=1 Tax=Cyanobium sp. ATX-6F1 TaxID=3137388 RepID=UPI0039BE60B5